MADLAAFFPRIVCDLIEPALEGQPAFKRVAGTVLFCDVAGFTALTEALSVLGREGAEELTRILNGYFSRMIGIIEEEGGDVLRFGGDAMTVLFTGDKGERTARAAHRMLEAMDEFVSLPTRAGTFGLTMKMGASLGMVLLGILGDDATGRDFYAAGKPLDEAAEGEHRAEPGLTVLHPAFLKKPARGLQVRPLDQGYALLLEPPKTRLRGLPILPSPSREAVQRLVPTYLKEFATRNVPGEHRGTAVLFVAISGLDFEVAAAAHDKLKVLYALLSTAATRYGGILNKLDMGDKGTKALLFFGSPKALEKREEMALRCALELVHSPELPEGVSLKMGLASAPIFSGLLGSWSRREYTAMGRAVNLAARLMQAAAHEHVLCDESCRQESASVLRFATFPPLLMKGFSEPVPSFEPLGELEEESHATEVLVEREEAKSALEANLLEGKGGAVALVGEAGLGKTALVEWAAASARAQDLSVVRVPLGTYSTHRPFSAWRGPVRAMLGVQRGDSPERVRAARDSALSGEPAGHRSLLNPMLDLPEEPAPALKNLSPRERNDLTFAVLSRLLASSGTRAIILDNLHAADPLSVAFLAFLLESPGEIPARIVVTLRPGNSAADSVAEKMRAVRLQPLSPVGMKAVLAQAFGFVDVEKEVLEWIAKRSKRIPAFLRAVVTALQSQGLILKSPAGARIDADRLFASSFPETLEGLYLAPLDTLPALEKSVLQHASVLGYDVSHNLLALLCGQKVPQLERVCQSLAKRGFLQTDTWGARPYYRFVDGLLRDAVYAAVPFSIKRAGHLRLAVYLEERGKEEPKLWGTLAHHYEAGGEEKSALKYHRLAGRDAVRRFDNVTALRHLEPVCAHVSSAPDDIDDAFSLMDVYWTLGKPEDASKLLRQVDAFKGRLVLIQRARLCNYLSEQAARSQNWKEAEKQLFMGVALSKQAKDVNGEGKALVNLVGRVYGPTGRLEKARECLGKALALPMGPGQTVFRTMAAMNLATVLWFMGRSTQARKFFMKAFQEGAKGRLGPQRGMIADNLCSMLSEMGRFSESAKWGKRAVQVLDAFAIRGVAQNARYNLSLAYLSSGRSTEVLSLLETVCRQAVASGNSQTHGAARQGVSNAALQVGDIGNALSNASAALGVFKEIRNARDYRFTLIGIGGLFYAIGTPQAAREFYETNEVAPFLKESPGDAVADVGLKRVEEWMSGGSAHRREPERFLKEGAAVSPEETLERILWICEGFLEGGQILEVSRWMKDARKALKAWPHFDSRLRVLRLETLIRGSLPPTRMREASLLLSRCIGSVWGLRFLCTLWVQEKDSRRKRRLRRKALERLAFVKEHSPGWAWEKIEAFPEIAEILSSA